MPMTLEDRILCVRLYSLYGKPSKVQLAWRKKFGENREPPSTKTIVAINKKFDTTGSVADMTRTGRPKTSTTSQNVNLVEAAIKRNPKKTIRALADDLGMNKSSVMRIKQEVQQKGNLEESKKLKDKIVSLSNKVEIHERHQCIRKYDNENGTGKFKGNPQIMESNQMASAMIVTPVMSSSTENGTQILHIDPETFKILQAQCSNDI